MQDSHKDVFVASTKNYLRPPPVYMHPLWMKPTPRLIHENLLDLSKLIFSIQIKLGIMQGCIANNLYSDLFFLGNIYI